MLFCPFCATLLLLEQETGLMLYCSICTYKCSITEDIVVRTELKRKAVDDVLGGEEAWQNVAKTEANCPAGACDSSSAYFFQIQTRSVDEPMTIFYKCVKCEHRWKEN